MTTIPPTTPPTMYPISAGVSPALPGSSVVGSSVVGSVLTVESEMAVESVVIESVEEMVGVELTSEVRSVLNAVELVSSVLE
jgi:hypothetical protein